MSRNPASNYGVELDRYKDHVAEEIAILRDALAVEEAKYARLCSVDIEHDPDPSTRERPGIDMSMFDTAGTDVREQYRPIEDIVPRTMVDVETGGRT